jgi:hypothetical protein
MEMAQIPLSDAIQQLRDELREAILTASQIARRVRRVILLPANMRLH